MEPLLTAATTRIAAVYQGVEVRSDHLDNEGAKRRPVHEREPDVSVRRGGVDVDVFGVTRSRVTERLA